MASLDTQLVRAPAHEECLAVAQRYLDGAVPSMDPKHRKFIATVCAHGATKSRTYVAGGSGRGSHDAHRRSGGDQSLSLISRWSS